jgi:sirohydrochlorin cobaltochelatase
MSHGIVLLGHGSRDPLWHRPMEGFATRIRELRPQGLVRCAYLELSQPDLATAAAELVAAGADTIRVLPLFLGVGKHAREDLPRLAGQLRLLFPVVLIELLPPLGEDPRLLELVAQIAIS